jgi:uncharacterized membrane protein YhaH (DUF805 family)
MNPIALFTSFEGRIGRLAFWLGLIVIAAASPFTIRTVLSSNPTGTVLRAIHELGLVGLGWSIALIYGVAALMTKRLHDRGKSGVYAALFYLPAVLAALTLFAGEAPYVRDVVGWSRWIAGWLGASGLWFLIDLGLFPGQRGANRFGPGRG